MFNLQKKKTWLTLLVTLVLIGSIIAGIILLRKRQEVRVGAAGANLTLVTTSQNFQKDETFIVSVFMDTRGFSVTGADIRVKFNTNILQATSISSAGYLPVVFVPGQINGDTASIVLGSEVTQPKNGSGILARITFKALNPGTVNLTFGSNTAIAALGQQTNIVDVMGTLNITVNGPTALPTLVPTASPTIRPSNQPTATPTAVPTIQPTASSQPTVVPSGAGKVGDVNSDGSVNIVDIGIIIDNYGLVPVTNQKADLNNDGNVNIVDIGIVIDNYGL